MTRTLASGSDGETDRELALDAAAAGISVLPEQPHSLDQAKADTLLLDLRHLLRAKAARRSAATGTTVQPLDARSELVEGLRTKLEAEADMPHPQAEG